MPQKATLAASFFFLAASAAAQVVTYPLQTPKNPEATSKAGIGSYSIGRSEDSISVEVFDPAGQPMAVCEPIWSRDVRRQTCQLADGRWFRAEWREMAMEFEDLASGEYLAVRFEENPAFEELAATDPSMQQGEFVLNGTKTYEEVERDWAAILRLFSFTMTEVQTTLGLNPGQLASASSPSQGLIRCAPGDVAFCDTSSGVSASGNGIGIPEACTRASQNADLACREVTGETCCANSLCSGICFFDNLCRMSVQGFLWACQHCV